MMINLCEAMQEDMRCVICYMNIDEDNHIECHACEYDYHVRCVALGKLEYCPMCKGPLWKIEDRTDMILEEEWRLPPEEELQKMLQKGVSPPRELRVQRPIIQPFQKKEGSSNLRRSFDSVGRRYNGKPFKGMYRNIRSRWTPEAVARRKAKLQKVKETEKSEETKDKKEKKRKQETPQSVYGAKRPKIVQIKTESEKQEEDEDE